MAFDNIRLEKSMYREAGKTFTQVLESLDPTENYRGTNLEHTDAFQRQLSRFGIACKGAHSSPVEKFFSTFQSAVLFPEYVARCVRQGMDESNILPAICATTTVIDAMDYRAVYSVPSEDERALKSVGEGAEIPATTIRTKENLIKQLTAPVRWSHIVANMAADGMTEAVELGPGKVLQGLIGRTCKDVAVSGMQ